MNDDFTFSRDRAAYVLEGPGGDSRYRLVVPQDLIADEAGTEATEDQRLAWLRDNLPNILGAFQARTTGGWVKAPWNRVLVEETD